MVRKDTVLDSWKTVRQDTAQAVEDFPAAELGFKATADLMSFGELARHILDAGHALTGMLVDGVDNLATPQFREMIGKYKPQLPERSEEHTSELQSLRHLVCRLLLEKKKDRHVLRHSESL